MNHTKFSQLVTGVGIVLLLLAGCNSPVPTPTATPVPPTSRPLPPTAMPPTPTPVEEKYEAVAAADYEPNMELSGRIQWDENGSHYPTRAGMLAQGQEQPRYAIVRR